MTTMTSENKIQQLIDRYMAGETSPTDEQELARLLEAQHELPTDWAAVRAMLGELTLGAAHFDRIVAQRRHRHTLLHTAWIAAACAVVVLVVLFWPSAESPTKQQQTPQTKAVALQKVGLPPAIPTTVDAPAAPSPPVRTTHRQRPQPELQPTEKEPETAMEEPFEPYVAELYEPQENYAGQLAMQIRARGEQLHNRIVSQSAFNETDF
jgi:anti-sigma factor RsiW